jgi:hypothetical protein
VAKVTVPVSCLKWDAQDAFPNEVAEIFQSEGVWNPMEEFTSTGRISLPKAGLSSEDARAVEVMRARICERLRQAMPDPKQYEMFLAFLELNEWDVSFFVDTW